MIKETTCPNCDCTRIIVINSDGTFMEEDGTFNFVHCNKCQ